MTIQTINQWDLIEHKACAQQRKPLKNQKDNPQNGEKKIFVNDAINKGLKYTYKQLIQLNKKNQITQVKNRQKT